MVDWVYGNGVGSFDWRSFALRHDLALPDERVVPLAGVVADRSKLNLRLGVRRWAVGCFASWSMADLQGLVEIVRHILAAKDAEYWLVAHVFEDFETVRLSWPINSKRIADIFPTPLWFTVEDGRVENLGYGFRWAHFQEWRNSWGQSR